MWPFSEGNAACDGAVEGLGERKKGPLDRKLQKIGKRWFVVRTAGSNDLWMLQPRWAISLLRGPMTARELRRSRRA